MCWPVLWCAVVPCGAGVCCGGGWLVARVLAWGALLGPEGTSSRVCGVVVLVSWSAGVLPVVGGAWWVRVVG